MIDLPLKLDYCFMSTNRNPEQNLSTDKKSKIIIWILSVAIPVAVAVLIIMPQQVIFQGKWVFALPHFNAVINSATTILLIAALIAIKKQKANLHKRLMITAFILGALFLVSYVIYHASAPSTVYGDFDANSEVSQEELSQLTIPRGVYLFILLTHILLAVAVVPLVLLAMNYAIRRIFDKHVKIVKYAYPIWLYVSVTGVLVYLMISPFYNF